MEDLDSYLTNAGIISSMLGFLSAVTLGVPAYREIRERRHWDTLARTVREQAERARASGNPLTTLVQLDEVQWNFVKQRMGSYLAHRRTIVIGLIFLGTSFAFDVIDNVEEINAELQRAEFAGTAS